MNAELFTGLVLSNFNSDIELALTLILFVWLLNWLKTMTGDAKLAIIIAVIVSYLTFYRYPELIWLMVAFILVITFGKQINEFLNMNQKK